MLLPTLLAATAGRKGTFVEIGALDGITYANTRALDRCYDWHGLLVEGNPYNFAKLAKTPRPNSKKVHAAVCAGTRDGKDSTIQFSKFGGPVAGDVRFLPEWNSILAQKQLNQSTVAVPCRPLTRIMSDAGFPSADFLSLDVEGAEAHVLRHTAPEAFKVVLVEWREDKAAHENAEVHHLLLKAGLRRAERLRIRGSRIYLADGVREVYVNDTWLQHGVGFRHNQIQVIPQYKEELLCMLSRANHSSCA